METEEAQEIKNNDQAIKEFKDTLLEIEVIEKFLMKVTNERYKARRQKELKEEIKALNEPYKNKELSLSHVYTFLMHAGILNRPNVTLLDETAKTFDILIKSLDKDYSLHSSIKIGVIYVKRNQFDQKSILHNEEGSVTYEKLIGLLGKPLEKDLIEGQSSFLCYMTKMHKLVFHVVTLMKTKDGDDQQLEKKKYVANDSIHIVWSENDREYTPGTITSHFNFIHLIVYPLRNGLCRISIQTKKEEGEELVKFFGPLMNEMMLPLEILVPLLRYTSINARKNIISKKMKIPNPILERKAKIKQIINNHAKKISHESNRFLILSKLTENT